MTPPRTGPRGVLRRVLLAAGLGTAAIAAAGPGPLGATRTASAEEPTAAWTQSRGDASRSGAVDTEPLRSDPVPLWSIDLGKPQCDPVSLGTFTVVVAGRKVHVVETRTGRVVDTAPVAGAGPAALAAEGNAFAVACGDSLRGFRFDGSKLESRWTQTSSWSGDPALAGGTLFVPDAKGRTRIVDLASGRAAQTTVAAGHAIAVRSVGEDRVHVLGFDRLTIAEKPVLVASAVTVTTKRGAPPVVDRPMHQRVSEDFAKDLDPRAGFPWVAATESDEGWVRGLFGWRGVPYRVRERGQGAQVPVGAILWYALDSAGGYNAGSDEPNPPEKSWRPLPSGLPPAFRGSLAVVPAKDGGVPIELNLARGEWRELCGAAPAGGVAGGIVLAKSVVYAGNWAFDTQIGKILWTLPDARKGGTLVPVANGVVAYWTEGGRLAAAADQKVAAEIEAARGAAAEARAPGATPAPALSLAALLEASRQPSWAILADGSVLAPFDGDAAEGKEVLVSVVRGAIDIRGDEAALERLLRRALDLRWIEALLALQKDAAGREMPTDALRLVAEAVRCGLPADQASALQLPLRGKKDHPQTALRRKAFDAGESAARAEQAALATNAARVCAAAGFPTAATTLYDAAVQYAPETSAEVDAAAAALAPAFLRARPDGAALWRRWAKELLPARGELLAPDDPLFARVRARPGWGKLRVGVRSANLLFFCAVDEPELVGTCVRNGEWTVRVLRTLLGTEGRDVVRGDADRLEVRVHGSRADYLAEPVPGGVPEWSAGFYSPADGVSRFYTDEGGASLHDPLQRGLFKTLSHELTHHYLSARWTRSIGTPERTSAALPGYWIVEGIARFLEDQVVEMDRRGLRFDDQTAGSVDAAAQLLDTPLWIPVEKLTGLSQMAFAKLSPEFSTPIRLRHASQMPVMSEIGAFYELSGALCFFLANRCGEDGRARFVAYLEDVYAGRPAADGWKRLGFENAAALESAFRGFLRDSIR